ncbi:hypothetical protein CFP65_6150 [Kitasatospora sp. MMS16-BH015]|uniref:hypothetical protein n=1 Tax=Kitasatospora sp. MMS16-BH015 TaxID=2018025 RepID=UPI000CA21A7A|nr:hypothetical protein [Kitasatospora sp. MMS16-BH015]AUG80817.1 hypothetical protein CFP65_6150 [Kitasatospora sp. MMS16-BH015]
MRTHRTRRSTGAALAALLLGTGLLLTACGPTHQGGGQAEQQPASTSSAGAGQADSQQLQEMQQKVDGAESAAAQAESDAGQNN